MISTWKQELAKNTKNLIEHGDKSAADPQAVIGNRHRKIGQLQVERNFLAVQVAIVRRLKGAQLITRASELSIVRQAKPLGISSNSVFYHRSPESEEELDLLKRLDELFT